tara:strand:- start:69075 stop:69644 length:570 start_codon:yes stop_codon:yes gene_type:complete
MDEIEKLRLQLIELQGRLRIETMHKYNRVNPFVEDITDWKERGDYLFGKGKNITVYNTCSVVGHVEVGENTWIGPYTAIDGTGGVKIGSFCSISSGVQIVSHDTVKWALSGGKAEYEYAPIEIGDNCFIGTNAMITKGVMIGDHCLIGAGAVVTKNIPNNSIVFGVPAKIVGLVIIECGEVSFRYFDSI